MKNKKIFELPEYFSMDANNSAIKDFIKKRKQAEDHLELLGQQAFCLNLMKFFNEFTDVHELRLNCKYYGFYILNIFINGKEEDYDTTIFKYFADNLGALDKEKLGEMRDGGLIVKKDNIQAACLEWMGEENYQKWKCLNMEDKLREHTKPTGEYKQKKKMV